MLLVGFKPPSSSPRGTENLGEPRTNSESTFIRCRIITSIEGHDCVYEGARGKPGVKAGAIENIHRRLNQLESRISRQERNATLEPQRVTSQDDDDQAPPQGNALSLLASELLKLANQSKDDSGALQQEPQRATKRRRVEINSTESVPLSHNERPPLPSPELLESVIRTYFTHIQPWIPMLHIEVFPRKLKTAEGIRKQQLVIHAISIAVELHIPTRQGSESSSSLFDDHWPAARVRNWVVTKAMETVSLEGLQALIIVAFTDIGNGNASRAWSLIASLSRTVEFAQLTVDHYQDQKQEAICRPYTSLQPARDWTEQEERRRIFWNVFLLDRFCSTAMGWTTSLKSIEVHQRLPCDGGLWRRQESGSTPYLGIWDKSTGGMTNRSSQWVPGGGVEQSVSPLSNEPWTHQPGGMYSSPSGQQTSDFQVDMSRVGAFGYCIEATESMSRVVSCFLQQRVNINDPAEVNVWLARFKELDMRLVHWRMFLPQKWKNNVPPSTPSGDRLRIDPNLTLAHVTHNASTILLHQVIAYPPSHWPFRKRLPIGWSADTCCFAAAEIATIASKYLEVTPTMLPVTSPFAFCLYVAARMMIIHWRFEEENKLMDEFWVLIRCLEDMSRRWRGFGSSQIPPGGNDLSAKYAQKLKSLWARCSEDGEFRVHVSDYTCEVDYRASSEAEPDDGYFERYAQAHAGKTGVPSSTALRELCESPIRRQSQQPQWAPGIPSGLPPLSHMTGPTYTPQDASQNDVPGAQNGYGENTNGQLNWDAVGSQDHGGVENMQGTGDMMMRLLNHSMEMDRVIAFDEGGLFTAELEHAVW
ncbi:fungal specific transcription factor domain-containing protein [Sarocladium implicatum]|nr:fungal specific transcription factor domain-containing protein [Sarocladium implicatum]